MKEILKRLLNLFLIPFGICIFIIALIICVIGMASIDPITYALFGKAYFVEAGDKIFK